MTILDQAEVERLMYQTGKDAAGASMLRAEQAGRAHQNRYSAHINDNFVLPLAGLIARDIGNSQPGKHRAHVVLLKPLPVDQVAALAVRFVIGATMRSRDANHRTIGYGIGRTIHRELVLAQIELSAPELYHTLSRDLARRQSTDERHKLAVYKDQARKAGIEIAEWNIGSRDQVGLYILGLLEDLGMVEIGPLMTVRYKAQYRSVYLTPEVTKAIGQIKDFILETSPAYGPCVEEPLPWTTNSDGGFHSAELRRTHRMLVKCCATARTRVREHDMPIVRSAANALQGTRWAVNGPMLDLCTEMSKVGLASKEVVTAVDAPKPFRPEWMDHIKKEDMSLGQLDEFKVWKRAMSEWHTERKLKANSFGRFYTASRQGRQFRDTPELFFVYFADSRGRLYPMTYGLNPQGSDLQKALLTFAHGLPVHQDDALKWFMVQGANKYGFDKATLEKRVEWVKERHDILMHFGEHPLDNLEWMQADKPLQFMAWCMEYVQFHKDPGFVSKLPISMDGSCNGLQNFSAMLRDEVGGKATNLTDNAEAQDIYAEVAEATMRRLAAAPEDDKGFRSRWIQHGISRKVTKKPVMTTPYGVTINSSAKYVVSEYLADPAIQHQFTPTEFGAASRYLMQFMWPAIGDVVVKSRAAMTWLKSSSKLILADAISNNDPDPVVSWVTPSGFLATQGYFELKIHRIRTLLHGEVKIRVASESDKADMARHASGMAPNFVHSMDASHLHLVTHRAASEGIRDLAMIHDDFGTHAAHSERFSRIIREEFVTMYENHDPLGALRERYPFLRPPPKPGTLDLSEVLRSEFFFS